MARGGGLAGRGTFEPGWKWSEDVKPIAGTASCQAAHTGYVTSGRMHVAFDDGSSIDVGPGDVGPGGGRPGDVGLGGGGPGGCAAPAASCMSFSVHPAGPRQAGKGR